MKGETGAGEEEKSLLSLLSRFAGMAACTPLKHRERGHGHPQAVYNSGAPCSCLTATRFLLQTFVGNWSEFISAAKMPLHH